jgi:tripartite-type tricarboxylate transporter receptor subunit TctC
MSASRKHVANFSVTALRHHVRSVAAMASCPAAGQESYPSRLVRMVVPFPAGGTADVLPRILGEKLSGQWRQSVIIENRAGAGGNIGAEAVAGSPPDGYVLMASPPGPIAINDNLYKKLGFEPSKFEPVIVLGTVPNVLVVKPAFPAQTAEELIAYARANPGKVTFASQGNGSTDRATRSRLLK